MTCPPEARPLVVLLLAAMKGLTLTKIGSRIGMDGKTVSYHLTKWRNITDSQFELLLRGVEATPADVAVAMICYEALVPDPALTPEERDVVETEVREVARWYRGILAGSVPLSREAPPLDEYPRPSEAASARGLAALRLLYLKGLPEAADRLPVLKAAREMHTWALCEKVAEEAVQSASRKLDEAFHWARLARHIARWMKGPEGWKTRLRGYSTAVFANALRVSGRLKAADKVMKEARRLWVAGSDPDHILDPGRLLDLEASLRRAQRRFPEAIATLDAALLVSRTPARILIKKGFTLEVMGDYEGSVEALLQADLRLDKRSEPRFWYSQRFNLAVNFSHVGRYTEARCLLEQVREVALELQDEIFLHRITWLEGRIAAGLGRPEEARLRLDQARREFAERKMFYDVALALLEHAGLLLDEGRMQEVKALALHLREVFQSEDVHEEALSALRLFREAVEREEATAELAYRILAFLFRAQHDRGLRFSS
jgi:tetratricopeptide (TPR) repeat protein